MMSRRTSSLAMRFAGLCRASACGILVTLVAARIGATTDDTVSTSLLEWEFLEAETALAQSEPRLAASHYRGAIREAWFLLGTISVAEGDLQAARDHLTRARHAAAVDLAGARSALALVELHLGEIGGPLRELRFVAREDPSNALWQRRLVVALAATDRQEEFAAELEKLRELDPLQTAEASQVAKDRALPLPQTGKLEMATAGQREHLRSRLAASLVRAYRNLARIERWTGFGSGHELDKAADEVAQGFARARDPFGRVDWTGAEPAPRLRPLRLDPVALMVSEPPALRAAIVALDEGDPERAESALRLRLGGVDGAAARSLLGRLLVQQGRRAAGEDELQQAAANGSSTADQALARLYWFDERRDEAISHLRQAAAVGSLDRDLAFVLAEAELAAGQLVAAERQLASLDKRFDSVEALLRLVSVARQAGLEKRAHDAAQRAARLAPSCEEVLLTHARLALEVGVVDSASRSIEALVRMRPEVAEYRYLLGQAWSQRRKMGEAAAAFLAAVKIDPEAVEVFLPLGLALHHESRFTEARAFLQRYLSTYPDDLQALAGLAEVEERIGELATAERRALGVLARDPDHARANLVMGMIRTGRGELTTARAAFHRAVEADPLLAKAHYQLSLTCARLGDRACAERHLELYKKALLGPESTYVLLEASPTSMTRQSQQEDEMKDDSSP